MPLLLSCRNSLPVRMYSDCGRAEKKYTLIWVGEATLLSTPECLNCHYRPGQTVQTRRQLTCFTGAPSDKPERRSGKLDWDSSVGQTEIIAHRVRGMANFRMADHPRTLRLRVREPSVLPICWHAQLTG